MEIAMEILFWCSGIIWLTGWVSALATVSAKMKKHKINYPHDGVKYATPLVLLFTWPYFYFYGKAL